MYTTPLWLEFHIDTAPQGIPLVLSPEDDHYPKWVGMVIQTKDGLVLQETLLEDIVEPEDKLYPDKYLEIPPYE